jgi:hypothetical protein
MFWLGLLALVASGTAQHQLSFNVLDAALKNHTHEAAGHYMPDGTFMAGPMHGDHTDASEDGGHTHKGHADCNMCGAVAAMASLTIAATTLILPPPMIGDPHAPTLTSVVIVRRNHAPYASRAPPSLNG